MIRPLRSDAEGAAAAQNHVLPAVNSWYSNYVTLLDVD